CQDLQALPLTGRATSGSPKPLVILPRLTRTPETSLNTHLTVACIRLKNQQRYSLIQTATISISPITAAAQYWYSTLSLKASANSLQLTRMGFRLEWRWTTMGISGLQSIQ